MTTAPGGAYPARLMIDYPDRPLDRVSTLLRLFYVIPAVVLLAAVGQGVGFAIFLMILFRQKYPRWLFDFTVELLRLQNRVSAYGGLMSDEYPSSEEEQYVHLEFDYPNVKADLNRWLPLVKWFLAIPHFVVLAFLALVAILVVIIAWFAILFTGTYPRAMFDFIEGFLRWSLRVEAYAVYLITDRYPPFSLD